MAVLNKIGIAVLTLSINLGCHSIKYSVYDANLVNCRYSFPTFDISIFCHFLPFHAISYHFLFSSSSLLRTDRYGRLASQVLNFSFDGQTYCHSARAIVHYG